MTETPQIRGASEDDPLLELDARGRVSLGRLAAHRRYLVTVQDNGQILLTPVTVLPADHPLVDEINRAVTQPDTRIQRGRPNRAGPDWSDARNLWMTSGDAPSQG